MRKGVLCALTLLLTASISSADVRFRTPSISALDAAGRLFAFVACTGADLDWAEEHFQQMRIHPGLQFHGLEGLFRSPDARVFEETLSSDELPEEDQLEAGAAEMPLAVLRIDDAELDETAVLGGSAEVDAAIQKIGLGIEQLAKELPPAAEATLTIYELINKRILMMALMLRQFLGWDELAKKSWIENHVESTPQVKREHRVVRSGGQTPQEDDTPAEGSVSMKQVARSLFKILLGAVLGVLLFLCVQRM